MVQLKQDALASDLTPDLPPPANLAIPATSLFIYRQLAIVSGHPEVQTFILLTYRLGKSVAAPLEVVIICQNI